MPKLLRPFFLHRRELLGELCRAAWQSVCALIGEAAGDNVRPGMVAAVHTATFGYVVSCGRGRRRFDGLSSLRLLQETTMPTIPVPPCTPARGSVSPLHFYLAPLEEERMSKTRYNEEQVTRALREADRLQTLRCRRTAGEPNNQASYSNSPRKRGEYFRLTNSSVPSCNTSLYRPLPADRSSRTRFRLTRALR